MKAEKIVVEEPELEQADLYDDLPPARPATLLSLGSILASILLNEVKQTLQDVNKALAIMEEIERGTAPRQGSDGQLIQSSFAEGVVTRLKQSGIEETLRVQIARLQASPFRTNLETTLRQYWEVLREQGNRLRTLIERQSQSSTSIRPEQYVAEDATSKPGYNQAAVASESPAEVAEATTPKRELQLDVFDEPSSGEVVLVAEHPGLVANSIRVWLDHDIATLTATDTEGQSYTKECLLPAPVEPNSFAQQYRNGVLEVRFKKI